MEVLFLEPIRGGGALARASLARFSARRRWAGIGQSEMQESMNVWTW